MTLFVHRREGSPQCCRDAGMCWRNIDADDSTVHVDIRRTIGFIRIHGRSMNDRPAWRFREKWLERDEPPQVRHLSTAPPGTTRCAGRGNIRHF